MEIENVNSKANAGVTLGTIGTALSGLQLLGSHLGCGGNASTLANAAATVMTGDSAPISRYEFDMGMKLAAKDSEIALLKSEQNTEVKIADVYARLKGDLLTLERSQSDWNASQMVNNAKMSSAIATNTTSIEGLQTVVGGITKTVVPKDAICPEFMDRYNSWTAPTA